LPAVTETEDAAEVVVAAAIAAVATTAAVAVAASGLFTGASGAVGSKD
jgi:hypothetical protein